MITLPAFFGAYQTLNPSLINSIQVVTITIPTGATSATATIGAVDANYSVLIWGGFTTTNTGSAAREFFPRIDLTNSTTVTAYRNTSSSTHTVTIYATAVEFISGTINLIQKGTISLGATSIFPPDTDGSNGGTVQTATISPVDTSKSLILYLGNTVSSTLFSPNSQLAILDFYSSSKVLAQRNSSGVHQLTIGYMVVEFKSSAVAQIQHRSITLSSANASDTDTITAVTPGRSMLIFKGVVSNNSTWSNALYHIRLTDGTTVTLERAGTSTITRTVYYSVIEFAADIASLQRNTITLSGSFADSTISPVNTAKAITYLCGQLTSGTVANQVFSSVKLFDSTTVRAEKNGASTSSAVSWETIEFN